ncbi:ABC transporter substrate-binding protein [Pseudomonas vanderleydeniana]
MTRVCMGWLPRLAACVLALLVCHTLPQARAADVLLTGAEDSPGVQGFASALAQQRPEDQVRFVPFGQLPPPSKLPASTRLILLDPPSLDWRLADRQGPPTLVLRISRLQARQRLGEQQPHQLSLLWSDPPPWRQLRLIRAVLPQAHRVGVLYDSDSEFLLAELRHAAQPLDLEIVAQRWDDTADSRPLQNLLRNSDVLLGIDDSTLYNPKTAKNLLLSSYARQLALIGPNAGFVRAGSLASSYSDQNDWLAILDGLLDQPPSTWPRALYPSRFKILSNPQVARSLSLEMIDEASVASRLAEGEPHP